LTQPFNWGANNLQDFTFFLAAWPVLLNLTVGEVLVATITVVCVSLQNPSKGMYLSRENMKNLLLIIIATLAFTTYGQDKNNHVSFNKLTEVEGTEFVIAQIENWGKMEGLKNRYLLFIDTKNGQTNQVDFPNEGYFQKIEQVKIDNLEINCLLISAQTVDLDGKKGIDWNDPT
jgi:hypothetical protein